MDYCPILKYDLGNSEKLFHAGDFSGEKILIVGGGFQQYHAIREAVALGLEVYVADQNPECPGASLVPNFWNINCLDKDQLLENCDAHNISFAFTMQSDLPVPSVAYINDYLRCEPLHYQAALNCSRKDLFRECLKQSGFSQPEFLVKTDPILSPKEEVKLRSILRMYKKFVVKPSDSSGSRGVQIHNRYDQDLLKASIQEALHFSVSGVVVVEGFVSGLEFGAQTMSLGGKCTNVLIHSDHMDGSGRIPLTHRYPHPTFTKEQLMKFEYQIALAVDAIGIQYGPANVDCIVDANDNVHIIEIGARVGSTCLPELSSIYSGCDWINLSIGISSGKDFDYSRVNNLKNMSSTNCFGGILTVESDMRYRGLHYDRGILQSDHLKVFEVHKKLGQLITKLKNGTDNYGRAIVSSSGLHGLDSTDYWNNFLSSLRLP